MNEPKREKDSNDRETEAGWLVVVYSRGQVQCSLHWQKPKRG